MYLQSPKHNSMGLRGSTFLAVLGFKAYKLRHAAEMRLKRISVTGLQTAETDLGSACNLEEQLRF